MPSVTRRAARSPEHREAVIRQVAEAVERLLEDGRGYTTLGVQRIAEEAGIARSTFYLYFPDKTALLMRVTESATEELFAAAGSWLQEGFADLAALEQTLQGVIAQQREHAALLAALTEVAGYDERVAQFWRRRVGGFVDLLRGRIADGQHAGTIAPALDPGTTAAWIAWGTERLVAQHVAANPPDEDEHLAAGLARAIWTTLGRAVD
ncbi:MAG: TetR/AcrR family transcriptional regulator [Solirubrobacteraceae bacterium]|jgi:TetR/AcrR family transcriptional regulator, ethionamide resistance regulator